MKKTITYFQLFHSINGRDRGSAGSGLMLLLLIIPFWGTAQNIVFPPESGVVNLVTDPRYLLRPNDNSTEAATYNSDRIQQAIDDCAGNRSNVSQTLYFPNGTYYVNKKMTLGNINGTGSVPTTSRGVTFQGQSQAGAILRLVDASPDYDGVGSTVAVPVLAFFEGTFNNVAMGNYVKNLTIDIGANNPNAIGLDFHNNNYGGISDVTIKSSDSQRRGSIGLKMNIENTGIGYVKNVRVEGFDYGIDVGAYIIAYMYEDIELEGQRVAGLVNQDKPIQIRRLTSRNAVPAIINTPVSGTAGPGVGTIVLIDSQLLYTGDPAASIPAINNREGSVFARNLTITYPVRILDLGMDRSAELPDGGEFSSRGVYDINGLTTTGKSMNLPVKDPPVIPWDENFTNWAIVDPGTDAVDDADAINAAIASGKSTVCIRYGTITINKPIVFPDGHNVKRFLVFGFVKAGGPVLTTNDGNFDPAVKKPVFEIGTGANEALVIQGIRTTNGNYFQYIQNNSKKTLILRSNALYGANRVYRNRYDAHHTPGTLFIEDLATLAENPYGVTQPGPGFLFDHQEVFARSFNPENVNPMMLNQGGKVWIMGFKTEGYGTPFVTTQYGFTEVLGGEVNGVFRGETHQEIINTTDASVSIIASEKGRFDDIVRNTVVVDTRYGVTKTLMKGVMPQTAKAGKYALSTDIPLFIAYVVNTAPVATTNASQTATTGSGFAYTVNPFTDAETPNSLTYAATGLPAELTFNPDTRVISGVPSTTVGSPYSVTITATDPGSLSVSTNFTITVAARTSVSSLSLLASADPATILTTETTTLLGTVSGGTAPYKYTFTGPGSITASGNSATVSNLTAGVQTFTVTVSDATAPTSQTTAATVSVTVSLPPNTAPQPVSNGNRTTITGTAFSATVNPFTDAESPNSLTYAATGLPAELTFDPDTRVISGTTSTTTGSPFTVTITATDPGGLSASTTFTIRVLDPSGVSSLTGVVISQVYGGGGSSGTNPRNDFVELFNRSNVPVPLDGWTVQTAIGTGNFSDNVVDLTGTLDPGRYYLVQLTGGTTGRVLPTPDASNTTINLGSQLGKVAVVNSTVILECSSTTTPCPADKLSRIVDVVGYGNTNFFESSRAPALSNALAAFRKLNGCTDTDNNGADFATASPAPRNSASPANVCDPPVVTPLSLVVSASPTTILTTGTTTLSATVSGGTLPYSYSFTGPGTITASGNTATVSGLSAGIQSFTVVISDATSSTSQTISGTVSVTVTAANTAPTVANVIPPQSATVGQAFSYVIPASTFTDNETPSQLTLSVSGLPAGLSFTAPATISGTPSTTAGSPVSVTVTATDPGNLSASTSFALTVVAEPVVSSAPGQLRIFEVFGGGGTIGNGFRNDYIMLANYGCTAVSLDGYSIQYNSAGASGAWAKTDLSGLIQPGYLYLIQGFTGSMGTRSLPTPDATGTINVGSSAGKVALFSTQLVFTGSDPQSVVGSGLVDLVGYGTTGNVFRGSGRAPAGSNSTAIGRSATAQPVDDNSVDFSARAPNPQNSTSPINPNNPAGFSFSIAVSASSTTVCVPANITLTASGGASYTFSAGATPIGTGNQAIVTQTGTYSVTSGNASGCVATASISVTVNQSPAAPTLTSASRTVTQSNTPLPLAQFVNATTGNTLSFSGVNGLLNPPNADVSQPGAQSFSVTQTNASGCVSSATPFTITVQQSMTTSPASQTVCRSSPVVLNATTTGLRYEWYKNGTSAPFKLTEIASIQRGTSTASLTLVSVQTNANYYVKVFQATGTFTFDGPFAVMVNYGCTAPGARLAVIETVDVPLSVVLTPNPVPDGQLRAVVRGATGQPLSMQLLDLRGQVVRQQDWPTAESSQVVEWDISQQATGLYLLQAKTPGQTKTVKVVRQ